MLKVVGFSSLDDLTNAIVPKDILLNKPHEVCEPVTESEHLEEFNRMMQQNELKKSFLGMGFYGTLTPNVILRNVLENPGWYTAYTPYQAEISQGRMESLLNYQTMICDFTGLALSNASLLDEGSAAAEAMTMCYGSYKKNPPNAFFVDQNIHPSTLHVVQTRAGPLGFKILVGDPFSFDFEKDRVFGALLQYPSTLGTVEDLSNIIEKIHQHDAVVVTATDLMALSLIKSPGEIGADIAIGNTQRFGGKPISFSLKISSNIQNLNLNNL